MNSKAIGTGAKTVQTLAEKVAATKVANKFPQFATLGEKHITPEIRAFKASLKRIPQLSTDELVKQASELKKKNGNITTGIVEMLKDKMQKALALIAAQKKK